MITVITVNYNCARRTCDLVRSLRLERGGAGRIIVVDNASSPEDQEILKECATADSSVEVLWSQENLGFSGGNNLAIKKSMEQGDGWVLLLNPDTIADADALVHVQENLPPHPALVGFPLREGDTVAYAGAIRWLVPTLPHVYAPRADSSRQYVIGAAMAVHTSVFRRIGLLDERFFLYFEDAEYSCRARQSGIPVEFRENPVFSHGVSQSTRAIGDALLLRYHVRNALLFNTLRGPWWVRILLPLWAFSGMLKQLAKLLLMPSRRASSRAIAAGILDFYGRSFGKITPQESHRH